MSKRAGAFGCVLAGCLALTACQGEANGEADCSVTAQKEHVYSLMTGIYLWSDEAARVNPAAYATPEDLLDAMAYRKIDHWSNMQSLEPYSDYFDKGEAVSFGYTAVFDPSGRLRVAWTVKDSPAGRAGVERGATILAIGGVSLDDIIAQNLWQDVMGPNVRGTKVVHTIQSLDGKVQDVEIEKDTVNLDIVPVVKVLPTPQGNIGYILFFGFVVPAIDQLKAAFQELKDAHVADVVIDLRYNGGGLVSVAGLLGSLIGGPALEGKVLLKNTYNRHWSKYDAEMKLTAEDEGLGASRVVFLTSRSTASASEIVINGLKPFLPVSLVGDRTYGKPVGADTWQACNAVISPITFRSLNAEDQGDYFDGIQVDCSAPDDLDHQLGDTAEARLNTALELLQYGRCYPRGDGAKVVVPPIDVSKAEDQLRRLTAPDAPDML